MKSSLKKQILFLFLVFISGFGIGLGAKIIYESSTFKPYAWNIVEGPIIVNCYGKDFNKYLMENAIEYWRIRGEKIGFYEHEPPDSVCKHDWLKGFIILKKSQKLRMQHSVLANTRRYTSFEVLHGAVIEYKPGAQNLELINEHELGHALGYTHTDTIGHIMHPIYEKMGRDFWIP